MKSGGTPAAVPPGAVPQLVGAHEEEVAPGSVLGAVGELFEGPRLEVLGVGVAGIGEHEVVDDLGDPAEVAARRTRRAACASRASAPPASATYRSPAASGG